MMQMDIIMIEHTGIWPLEPQYNICYARHIESDQHASGFKNEQDK